MIEDCSWRVPTAEGSNTAAFKPKYIPLAGAKKVLLGYAGVHLLVAVSAAGPPPEVFQQQMSTIYGDHQNSLLADGLQVVNKPVYSVFTKLRQCRDK